MTALFGSALVLQTLALGIDEFYFHWQRNLPAWERWGHPIDTFFFLLALAVLSFASPEGPWIFTYLFLSALSCLVITKDEWVHREKASPSENWLHAILFILHPVVLFSAYFLWLESRINFKWIFSGIFVFWLYQLIFWNIYADRILKKRLGNY